MPVNARPIKRFLIAFALIMGLIVAIAPPFRHLTFHYRSEGMQIETEAQAAARRVARYAYAQGPLWVFHHLRLVSTLAGERPKHADEWRRLLGPDGKLIVEQGTAPAFPISRRVPIVVDGAEVGSIEIARGMSRHLETGAWLAAGSMLFGILMFAVAYVLPIRALNRAFAALRATNSSLERQAHATEKAHVELQAKHRHLEESNAQLELARNEAEAANCVKSRFVANMSHELRTPLNAVIGFTELVQTQFAGPVGAKYLEYMDDIHKSGSHLLKIVNDVLTYSRMEEGAIRLVVAPVEAKALMEECCGLVADQARAGKLTLACESRDAVGAMILADRAKLRLVLLNLVANAIKFTRPGGSVVMSASRAAGRIAISVADTGIGMTPDEIDVAVQRFRQVDESHTRRHDGIGLGLPIAKALVELHKGRMRIESTPGQGTTVTISLDEIAAGAGGIEPQLGRAA